MKAAFLILLCVGSLLSGRDLPWLGVVLEKAGKEEVNAVGLGDAVGLKVASVNPDGPCAKSMAQSGDLWWKLDGQILISKCQMVVLLRAKKPGDEVSVDFYREGKLQSMQVALAARPDDRMYSWVNRTENPPGSPRKLLTRREEVARLTSKGHDVSLQREGESLKFEVRKDGELVLAKKVEEGRMGEGISGEWMESYLILKLTLDQHATAAVPAPKRRVRYVPRNQGSKE